MTRRHVHHNSFSRFYFSVFPHKTFDKFSKKIEKTVEFTIEKKSPNKSNFLVEFFCQKKKHCSIYTCEIYELFMFLWQLHHKEKHHLWCSKILTSQNIHFLSSFIGFKVPTILHIYLNNLISTNEKWKCLHFEPQFLYTSSKHFNLL
jgi:hypothetical protein